MTAVVIGIDPAKRSHARAVLDGRDELLAALRVANNRGSRLAPGSPQRREARKTYVWFFGCCPALGCGGEGPC